MNIVSFKFNKFIGKDPFRINAHIEPIYIEIAEMVLSRIYKAYCFNPLFEEGVTIEEKTESLKFAIIDWADCFMNWKIDNIERAKKAVNDLICMSIYPTLGLFRASYFNKSSLIEKAIYDEYISYLYSFCWNTKDGKIYGADFFNTWREERTNANKNTE